MVRKTYDDLLGVHLSNAAIIAVHPSTSRRDECSVWDRKSVDSLVK